MDATGGSGKQRNTRVRHTAGDDKISRRVLRSTDDTANTSAVLRNEQMAKAGRISKRVEKR